MKMQTFGELVEPRGGWPLRPVGSEPVGSELAPAAAVSDVRPVDDLTTLLAALNTQAETFYLDRRPA